MTSYSLSFPSPRKPSSQDLFSRCLVPIAVFQDREGTWDSPGNEFWETSHFGTTQSFAQAQRQMQGLSRLEEPLATSQIPMPSATPIMKKMWKVLPNIKDCQEKIKGLHHPPPSLRGEKQLTFVTDIHGRWVCRGWICPGESNQRVARKPQRSCLVICMQQHLGVCPLKGHKTEENSGEKKKSFLELSTWKRL